MLGAVLALAGAAAWVWREDLAEAARGYAVAQPTALIGYAWPGQPALRGAAQFAAGDFGTLTTDSLTTVGTPWTLASTALALAEAGSPERADAAALTRALARHGFLSPTTIANWPAGAPPLKLEGPLGITRGRAHRTLPPLTLELGNLGCAACHAGVGYDAQGRPLPEQAWLAAPNTSLNLESYTQALYRALQAGLADEPRLMAAVATLHPGASEAELATLRRFVLPVARRRLAELSDAPSPLPFPNGLPGSTNGVAALKHQLGLAMDGPAETGFTSIPVVADRSWRSALLYDGAYAPAGQARWRPMAAADRTPAHADALAAITTYFTVPSMGQTPERARHAVPAARDTLAFLDAVRLQPFPGRIDAAAAARGQAVYARACAACHGDYAGDPPRLVRFPNWAGDVGTDRRRAAVFDAALVAAVEQGAYADVIDAAAAPPGAYAAPPLNGLWSSGPYLHNGSVPSVAALLGLEPRPVTFSVGGHALDLGRLAIAYPPGHRPFSTPAMTDTRRPGLSNAGHETQVAGLTEQERRDVLEFLKRL